MPAPGGISVVVQLRIRRINVSDIWGSNSYRFLALIQNGLLIIETLKLEGRVPLLGGFCSPVLQTYST